MSGLLNNSLSALLTARAGIATVSHNIANVNTDGFSRQRVSQAARQPEYNGAGYIGIGVSVVGIDRVYDSFLVEQARAAATNETYLSAFHDLATRVDQLFGNEAVGLSGATSDFFDSVDALARDPSSIPARQTVISQAQVLAQRFATLDSQLATTEEEIDSRLYSSVANINSLADSIANINDRITSFPGTPADLQDQRDQLLGKLAEEIDISVLDNADGTVSVFVGNGQSLVNGPVGYSLTTLPDLFDPSRLQVGYGEPPTQIPDGLAGGAIGGALEFRRTLLDPARAELGRIATGIAETFNATHATGMDLSGAMGGDFFSYDGPEARAASGNAGAAVINVAIDNLSDVEPRNYELAYGGGSWQLIDIASGSAIGMTGSGSAADPFLAEGLAITVSGAAADGDRFQLKTLSPAASSLKVAVNGPQGIAAASPMVGSAALANTGSALAGIVAVEDPGNPALSDAVNIVFDDPTTYRIFDSGGSDLTGPIAFSPGDDISFNGWRFSLEGQPAGADSFSVTPNVGGTGDNSVARRLLEVAREGLFGGGNTSIEDLQSGLLAKVGIATQQAEASLQAQSAVRDQAEMSVESVSGVNLDEEAVNLMRYQEAYQAAAKAIAVADTLFQTVLDAVR
ncbi:MAG: flagellar hook-associated protein FlgK [Gammaproteobacteria bacterium]|nr:flagellar hook-associated protein FlgK [Gammaproteobacteria bacterium]